MTGTAVFSGIAVVAEAILAGQLPERDSGIGWYFVEQVEVRGAAHLVHPGVAEHARVLVQRRAGADVGIRGESLIRRQFAA